MGFRIFDEDELEENSGELAPGPGELDLGPDERDLDLMDGTWEQAYYSGRMKSRNWNAIVAGVALLVVASLVVPMLLVFFD